MFRATPLTFTLALTLLTGCLSSEQKKIPVSANATPHSSSDNRSQKAIREVDQKLLLAAAVGDTQEVEELLASGADINARTETQGTTPLMEAVSGSHREAVLKLLERGAQVNTTDTSFGNTALILAAGVGDPHIVQDLLNKGADANVKNNGGFTALDIAEDEYRKDVISILSKAGGQRSGSTSIQSNSERESDFRLAAREGNGEKVKALLKQGVFIDAKDVQGWTALREAVFQENVMMVRLLLANKADPDVRDPKDGTTALHWAAQIGHDEMVRALLNAGANPNLPDTFSGSTPLYFAATGGHVAAVQALIAKGADVNAADKFGDRMLSDVVSAHESARKSGRRDDARSLGQIIQILKREGAE